MELKFLALAPAAFALVLAGCSSAATTAASQPTGSAWTCSASHGPVEVGQIAFQRNTDETGTVASLFVTTNHGKSERQLTKSGSSTFDDEPNWAPGGGLLIFTRTTKAGTAEESHRLFTVRSDGTTLTALSPDRPATASSVPGWDGTPAFSPDGSLIAFNHMHGHVAVGGEHGIPKGSDQLQYSDIWIMNADGTNRRQVTRSAAYSGDSGGVAWSPDGKRLVYARSNSAAGKPAHGRALFVVDIDGRNLHQLTPWSLGAGGTPDWASASNLIAFRAVLNDESGVGNFFTIHPDGTALTQITHFTGTVISHKIGFSPDGSWIVFAKAAANGANDVYTARADGTDVQRVTDNPQADSSGAWGSSPRCPSD
jgi:Tol biopolymer transport system component